LIFDEISSRNFAERQSAQGGAGLPPYVVIARPANVQITLFELVGKHEHFAKLVASHGEDNSRPERYTGEPSGVENVQWLSKANSQQTYSETHCLISVIILRHVGFFS